LFKIFCDLKNVFTVTFGQSNASLLNKSIKFVKKKKKKKKKSYRQPFEW